MNERTLSLDLENKEFQQAFRLLKETNANVFLTGRAGTGKSTFLRYICNHLDKKYVVLAPTGVAAVNVGGVTIHSFFHMPLRPVPPDDPDYSVGIFKSGRGFSRQKRRLLKELELIIIDEVSMVRPDMIDFIDRVLRGVKGERGTPFGGVQLLLVGDIFQLEPVISPDTRLILAKYYSDFFFFNAKAYAAADLVSVELQKIYRQTDPQFIGLLDRIRKNNVTLNDINLLNGNVNRDRKSEAKEFEITLTTRRETAAQINRAKMMELAGEEYIFRGKIDDDFPEKLLPTDLNLTLKKDAQVMLIRNDKNKRWVNGTLAKIKEIDSISITIRLEDGREERLEMETWNNIAYKYDEKEKRVKEEILGQFTQYPLRAAWALTIHKSQGLTFNKVSIDMGSGAFSAGQTYVALSRCRTLEGISFMNPIRRNDVIVSRGASAFSINFNDSAQAQKVFRETRAKRLSEEALENYFKKEYDKVINDVVEIDRLTGALDRSEVRRYISSKLRYAMKLEETIKRQAQLLTGISQEYCERGNDMRDNKDYKGAMNEYKRAVEIDENNIDAKFGLAQCLIYQDKEKEALKVLSQIERGDKKTLSRVEILKGQLYEVKGDLSRALLSYVAAAKYDKSSVEAVRSLISLYEKSDMEDEAEKYRGWLREES